MAECIVCEEEAGGRRHLIDVEDEEEAVTVCFDCHPEAFEEWLTDREVGAQTPLGPHFRGEE